MRGSGVLSRGARAGRAAVLPVAVLALSALAGAVPARAQDVNVRAQVDRSRVEEGGQVVLTVEV